MVSGWENGLYWLGGDGTRGRPAPLLVSIGFHCGSGVCGEEFEVVGSESSYVYEALETVAVLRNALMLGSADPTSLLVWPGEVEITLARMPAAAPFRVVADVVHGRVYVVSSAGLVATVGRAPRSRLRLPPRPPQRQAVRGRLAGSGKIALWGEDGLGTIDTGTWTTHAIAPGVSRRPRHPVRHRRLDEERRRDRRLHARRHPTVPAAPGQADHRPPPPSAPTSTPPPPPRTRYSVDLRTGKTTGPLPTSARIVTPSYVVIP